MIAVFAENTDLHPAAQSLAKELGLDWVAEPAGADALLRLTADGVDLLPLGRDAPGPVTVDFAAGAMTHRRRAGHNEPLGRAVGVGKRQHLYVADATAGLGRDSFVLADLGCQVTMFERSSAVFALLRDGLRRGLASELPRVAEACGRMQLERGEFEARRGGREFDVVYLDPMFPARRKSARVKKDMWIFQQLLQEEASPQLLDAALAAARHRVVVKRPARAPALAEREPSYVLPGKTVRFDVYLA